MISLIIIFIFLSRVDQKSIELVNPKKSIFPLRLSGDNSYSIFFLIKTLKEKPFRLELVNREIIMHFIHHWL